MRTSAAGSSSSGLPGRARGNRKGTESSSFPAWSQSISVYGFAKRQQANIDHDEEREFKEAAKHVLALTEKQLAELLRRGDFLEVTSE
jgi:hypothetical protein